MKNILFVILILFPLTIQGQDQDEPVARQLEQRLKTDEFRVGILLQSLANFSFNDDNFNSGRAFNLGATRLDIRGTVDSNFIYRLQMDFRRQASVLDAQVGYKFSDQLRIITGAYKPSLSRDLDPSPGDTDFINRARLVSAMMNSREIGITLLGESDGGFNYMFGMYNGTGLSRSNDNRFMYATRLGIESESENGTFNIGFNGALNRTRFENVGNTGLVSLGDRILYGVFAEYNSNSVFGTIELMQTRFDAQNFTGAEETITGFYGTFGTNISEKDQLLARWDHLSFDLRDSTSDLFVFGWNHQATRLISFQVNLLAQFDSGEDGQYGLSGNFQFQF